MYRATPDDKRLYLCGMKVLGAKIAMTAEGVADTKSLQESHLPIVMGVCGCGVA